MCVDRSSFLLVYFSVALRCCGIWSCKNDRHAIAILKSEQMWLLGQGSHKNGPTSFPHGREDVLKAEYVIPHWGHKSSDQLLGEILSLGGTLTYSYSWKQLLNYVSVSNSHKLIGWPRQISMELLLDWHFYCVIARLSQQSEAAVSRWCLNW